MDVPGGLTLHNRTGAAFADLGSLPHDEGARGIDVRNPLNARPIFRIGNQGLEAPWVLTPFTPYYGSGSTSTSYVSTAVASFVCSATHLFWTLAFGPNLSGNATARLVADLGITNSPATVLWTQSKGTLDQETYNDYSADLTTLSAAVVGQVVSLAFQSKLDGAASAHVVTKFRKPLINRFPDPA
jgi:hypothetical protein